MYSYQSNVSKLFPAKIKTSVTINVNLFLILLDLDDSILLSLSIIIPSSMVPSYNLRSTANFISLILTEDFFKLCLL